ncbi:hypothetical protein Gogos_006130 [Gossypium gossypioides]|uniref:RNase H type-1 domain-containing protein n=1 Tax=Gossypium gossypioides TaxID=34282 RepID=A0A7J9C4X3_GOSGO|nr:hypothetical protein [Gossypium gossypioides]
MELPPGSFLNLDRSDVLFLNKEVSKEEIKTALFDMAPLKSIGSDGFHALFFQNLWDRIARNNIDFDYFLKEMIMEEGLWNLDLFRIWLLEEIIEHIVSIPPPHSSSGSNMVAWAVCGLELEDVIHVLQDYSAANNVWAQIIPAKRHIHFFSGNLRIRKLLDSVRNWRLEHIPREENKEADQMAKMGFGREEGLELFTESPFVSFV